MKSRPLRWASAAPLSFLSVYDARSPAKVSWDGFPAAGRSRIRRLVRDPGRLFEPTPGAPTFEAFQLPPSCVIMEATVRCPRWEILAFRN
jgi:hypothetical protein